jgi:hypothetical protein
VPGRGPATGDPRPPRDAGPFPLAEPGKQPRRSRRERYLVGVRGHLPRVETARPMPRRRRDHEPVIPADVDSRPQDSDRVRHGEAGMLKVELSPPATREHARRVRQRAMLALKLGERRVATVARIHVEGEEPARAPRDESDVGVSTMVEHAPVLRGIGGRAFLPPIAQGMLPRGGTGCPLRTMATTRPDAVEEDDGPPAPRIREGRVDRRHRRGLGGACTRVRPRCGTQRSHRPQSTQCSPRCMPWRIGRQRPGRAPSIRTVRAGRSSKQAGGMAWPHGGVRGAAAQLATARRPAVRIGAPRAGDVRSGAGTLVPAAMPAMRPPRLPRRAFATRLKRQLSPSCGPRRCPAARRHPDPAGRQMR